MGGYVDAAFGEYINTQAGFEYTAAQGIRDATVDGIVLLEMSFGSQFATYYDRRTFSKPEAGSHGRALHPLS